MNRESQARFVAVLLFLLTVAAVVFAGFNFQKERESAVPDDGVWWVEHNGSLVADRVDPNGPGAKAGIKPDDKLVSVNGQEIKNTPGLVRQLYNTGVWSKATYSLIRQSVTLDSSVILVPADRSLNNWLRLIALIYLGIGVYVLLRRWTAPGSTHFYIFCLVSFIAYSFKYTGKLNDFDWTIYWSNIVAWVLQPALFLHFVLTFPEDGNSCGIGRGCSRWRIFPAPLLLGRHILALRWRRPAAICAGTWIGRRWRTVRCCSWSRPAVLWDSYRLREHDDPAPAIEVGDARHDSRNRSLHAVLRRALPDGFAARHDDEVVGAFAGIAAADLRLCHLPLSLDGRGPDLQARRGLHAGRRGGGRNVFRAGRRSRHAGSHAASRAPGRSGLILAVVVTALLFDPVRKWIQDRVDQSLLSHGV